MSRQIGIKSFLVVFALLIVSLMATAGSLPLNSGVPITIGVQPASPAPSQTVTFTVTMDQAVPADQAVAIGCTDVSAFVNLPREVVVKQGDSSVSFTATTSSSYGGGVAVTATSNGGSAICMLPPY
jgi:hypothetical protein